MELLYTSIPCKKVIEITSLVAVQYMDFPKNFTFSPEQHRCWELNFHDYGSMRVYAAGQEFTLSKHDMILYAPMVEHGITERTQDTPNVITITFESDSPLLHRLSHQVLRLPVDLQKQLSSILKLAQTFSEHGIPLNAIPDPLKSHDTMSEKQAITLQLITLLLEEFFLRLLSVETQLPETVTLPKLTAENRQANLSHAIQEYIEQHLDEKLTLQKISQHFNISVGKLCRDIKATTDNSLQELIAGKRLKAAKRMIRQEEYNFTEIAERLGFSSLHYFSQWFKKQTNRSPTEYATSVKGRSEH